MELLKQHHGWRLALENARVQMIQIDFRLSLLVSDGRDEAWAHIETSGVLRSGARELLFTPEQTPTRRAAKLHSLRSRLRREGMGHARSI
jgi:hypothetical protein